MLHISPDIIELFHIGSGLFIGRIGFPFLLQKSGVFLPQRFDGGQLCDPQLVKMFLRRLVQKDFRLMRRPKFFAVFMQEAYADKEEMGGISNKEECATFVQKNAV